MLLVLSLFYSRVRRKEISRFPLQWKQNYCTTLPPRRAQSNQFIYQSKKYLKFYNFFNIDSCSPMSSKEPRFTSHSVNITSSFIVYTQSSLWLHPCIVTEALIKLGIYEARILIIGDWAGWMMLFICRVLQLDESNLLSFKTPATCSDHKLAYFSQIIKKDKTKKKNPHKSSGNSWLTESDLFPTADGQCLRNVVESLILLACHLLPSNMYTKACCSQEGGSIFGCFNDLVGFLKGCLLPACTILTRASPWPDRQPEWRVLVLCYLGPLGDFWQEMLVRQFLWSESSS